MLSFKKSLISVVFAVGMVGTIVCMNNNNNVSSQGKMYNLAQMELKLEIDKLAIREQIKKEYKTENIQQIMNFGKIYNELCQMSRAFALMRQDGCVEKFERGQMSDDEINAYGARAEQQLQKESNDFLEKQRLIFEESAKGWEESTKGVENKIEKCPIL